MRLRQVALVAHDLARAKELLTKVIGTEVIYVDPGVGQWGLENVLVAVGGEVIEVVSPTRSDTAASRMLDKRGDGGYMLIMQNLDAEQRKAFIEERNLAKVIWTHKRETSQAVQYHPKGIKGVWHWRLRIVKATAKTQLTNVGGVIPELDSHDATEGYPTPLQTRFSPWHACGPDTESYIAAMKRSEHLSLLGVVCRLEPSEQSGEKAATQWEQTFGVPRSRDLNAFTNARLGFVAGQEGLPAGIISITIGVRGQKRREDIFRRAQKYGVVKTERGRWQIEMLGVRWEFVLTGYEEAALSRL